jgi:signal transduction histidine kinase
MTKDKQSFIKKLFPLAVLPLILAVCFGLWVNLIPGFTKVESETGVWDLRGIELADTFANIGGPAEHIRGALLAPEEFAAREGEAVIGPTQNEPYLTSRLRIILPDDGWYTFTRISIDFSQRVYVNGELLLEVGKPGESPDTDVPDTARVTFTARPVNGVVEIVQQSSNFVHREGGYHSDWHIGRQSLITYIRNVDFITSIILGCFLSLFLIFSLLFLMLRGIKANLYFALFCLMWFLRSGVTGAKIFSAVFPWLDWYAKFRMEYIAIPAAAVLTVAIIDALFPGIMHKAFRRAVYTLSAGFAALFLFADTMIMSRALFALYALYGPAILYIAARFVMKLRGVKLEQGVFLTGAALFLFSAVWDFLYYNNLFTPLLPVNTYLSGIAMLVFAFFEAAAVFIATMREVERAKEAERTLAAENALLDSLSRMKSDYLANISHEMRTPLSIMSGYAQQTEEEIEAGDTSEKTLKNLHVIQAEAYRLAELAGQVLYSAKNIQTGIGVTPTKPADILERAAAVCAPILAKNKNRLETSAEPDCPETAANIDVIVQVLVNLCANAGRHTKNGVVSMAAKQAGDFIEFTVRDNGSGIAPELLPHVFKRGVSGDDATGLGLAICNDVIRQHSGTIDIDSEIGKGTSVTFTLPLSIKGEQA